MQAPPSRYRVEERDRRLVTIDTLTGLEISAIGRPTMQQFGERTRAPGMAHQPRSALKPVSAVNDAPAHRTKFGEMRIVTSATFDDDAPREVFLSLPKIGLALLTNQILLVGLIFTLILAFYFWPIFLLVLIVPASRTWLAGMARARLTRWVDGLEAV